VALVAQAPDSSRRARLVRLLRERPRSLSWTAAVLLPALIAPLAIVRDDPQEVSAGRIYLVVVAVVAFLGGLGPALLATALSFTALAWLFAPPGEGVADTNQLGSLVLFLVAALVISQLLERRNLAQRDAAEARARAERLQGVTAALVEADSVGEVVDALVDQGMAASGAERGAVALPTADGLDLELAASRNYPDSMVTDFGRFPVDADLPLAEAARTGRPLFFGSRRERDARYPQLSSRQEETYALAAVPLVGKDRTIGAFALSFGEDRVFSAEERSMLETIAHQSAQALERAQLRERELEARRELALQTAILEAEGEASADGILLVSPEGRMVSFNRRFVELWELPDDLVATRSDAEVLKALESKLAEPQEFYDRVAYLYAHPDERSRDEIDLSDGRIVERYSSPVRSAEGELFGRVWYFRDITELRRGQEIATVLAAASDLLASTTEIEAVLQLVVRLPVPRLVGICTLYLLDEEGVPRLAAVSHWDPEHEEAVRELHRRFPVGEEGPILRALRTKETVRLPALDREALLRTAKSEEHYELMQPFASRVAMMVPLVAHGLTYGVLGIGTAPRRAALPDQKQQFAEELARRIAIALDNARLYAEAERRGDAARSLEHVADCVVLLDREGRLRYFNPAAESLLGLEEDKLGRPMAEALPAWRSLAEHLGSGGDTRTFPVQLSGGERWIAISAVRFGDGSVYTLRDVTEERTLETMRADFVSTASHELRTPLTAVYGAARTLLRNDVPLSDDHRDSFLRMIAAESERLATIVNDILLAGSLDADKVELASERCDVADLLQSVVESARMRLPENLELTLEGSNGPVPVECDGERVRQVLVNLVDNAIKYSPDGGEVEVALERLDDAVRFAVRDRGLGIPASQRTRVFDKFIRLDPNLHRGIGGTGLGLYICRELVRRMGGQIWVDGRDGGGSVFYVELPAASVGASK
jgi:PAS domain S-box-containing protein